VVVGFFTEEEGPQPYDGFFGVSTPQLSFQAMFSHAAATRKGGTRKPGGALACFAGGAVADGLFELSDDEIVARFARDLISVYPARREARGGDREAAPSCGAFLGSREARIAADAAETPRADPPGRRLPARHAFAR
jgi:hypothetical protein